MSQPEFDFDDVVSTKSTSNNDYQLDFDFDNFEEELSKEIEAVKTVEDFENVIDKFLDDLDFWIDLDDDDLDIDDIIKE